MPLIDYQCEACGSRWDEFHHSSSPPLQRTCECGQAASRIYSLPGERTFANARRFDPITIWVNNEDPDRISIPGHADDPVDSGYHKVEITSLAQADYWAKKINKIETSKTEALRDREKRYWDEVARERRADILARIGSNPRALALFQAVKKYVDAKRERRYAKKLDARVHFDVMAYDSSNRDGWSGPETGWKTRRK